MQIYLRNIFCLYAFFMLIKKIIKNNFNFFKSIKNYYYFQIKNNIK